jgi:Methyl-accepting chemotaxis protein
MKKNKRKWLLRLWIPILVVYLLIICAALAIFNQNGPSEFFIHYYSTIILAILGVGFCLNLGSLLSLSSKHNERSSTLADVLERLSVGEIDIDLIAIDDATDKLGQAVLAMTNKMRVYVDAADRLAKGEFSSEMQLILDNDLLGRNLISIGESLSMLEENVRKLSASMNPNEASPAGSNLTGIYSDLVDTINKTVIKLSDKIALYENAMDAIPFPMHILDSNAHALFYNKTLENLLQAAGLIENRETANGIKVCSYGVENCNSKECSENCSIYRLITKDLTTFNFEFMGTHNQKNSRFIKNNQDEKIGFIEITIDLTSLVSLNQYTSAEVARLQKNLLLLADGNLEFDMNLETGNQYTTEIHEHFKDINDSLGIVKISIGNLISDTGTLSSAIITGDLAVRADESKFSGSWKAIISGMNNILKEVEKPLHEVSAVMDAISAGNLKTSITGQYEGAFDQLKQSVNTTVNQLNHVIDEIATVTGALGNGNLNIEDVSEFSGDFVGISQSLNIIIKILNTLLSEIYTAALQVNSGAGQVAAGSQSLAQGATEQASTIEELTASITEIANQTKENAKSANQTRELTALVRKNADIGNLQMAEMQNSMVEINQSSRDISKIIKVIDEIAFQTNILSLNAAVEAARAGVHGKGFAVVAEEVRTLAARSAEAAKETAYLIEGSISKVQHGTRMANETAMALQDIVTGISQITDFVGNISSASSDQATGIAQISMGIEQVAQVVQQNSATSEESAAASEELFSQAELLKETISQFTLRK